MKIRLVISLVLILPFVSCEKEEDINDLSNKIEFLDFSVSDISYKTATVSSKILDNNGLEIKEFGHCWSSESNPDIYDSTTTFLDYSPEVFTSNLQGLNHNTNYYVRSYFKFGDIISYCKEDTFKTLEILPPTLSTSAISKLTAKSVVTGGDVKNGNGSEITARGVCWNLIGNPKIEDSLTIDGLGLGAFVSNLENLEVDTEIYIRAYATNEVGTGYGNEVSLTTKDGIPEISTTEIINLTAISVQTGGTITNDGGLKVISKGVCYNTTGSPTVTDEVLTAGSGIETFQSNLVNLQINTTYYVRTFVINELDTTYASELSFTTKDGIPEIDTKEITNIRTLSAQTGGTILEDGGLDITEKGVCWNTTGSPIISDEKTTDGSGKEGFTSSISGLSISTNYYVRAYTVNEIGVSYGNQIVFTTNDGRPVINTESLSEITYTSLKSGGRIISDEGSEITEKGICWNTTGTPVITDFKINESSGSESFTSSVDNLTQGETYFIRAFAINSFGVGYGNEISVSLIDGFISIQDFDGNWYNTVKIGTQIWLKENLKVTHYPDGTSISNGAGIYTYSESTPKYYFAYDNDESNVEDYGRLYTWFAAKEACLDGWHMPTESEWNILWDYVGMENPGKLKATGTIEEGTGLWKSPNDGATDEYGLSLVPGGVRFDINSYLYLGEDAAYFFSDKLEGYSFHYNSNSVSLGGGLEGKGGFPVRCIKD